jgi:hypothetical protein
MDDLADLVSKTVHWSAFGDEIRKHAGTVEVAHNFHPVTVQPPQAKRAKFPFTGFIDFQGLKIDVENKKGEYRRGKDRDGHEWKCLMHAHYGEIRNTEGTDGDKLDVYVGPNHDSSLVVVVRQHKPDTGAFDEDKVMVGFDSVEEAVGAYKKQYDKPGFYKDGDYKALPIGEFWRWVHDRDNHGKKVAGVLDGLTVKTAADLPDIVRPAIRPEIREFALHPHLQKGLAGAAALGGLAAGYRAHRNARAKELETGEPSTGKHVLEGGAAGVLGGAGLGAAAAVGSKDALENVKRQAAPSAKYVAQMAQKLRADGKSMPEIKAILRGRGFAQHFQNAHIGYQAHVLQGKIHTGKAALVGAAGLGLLGAGAAGLNAHFNKDENRSDLRATQRRLQVGRYAPPKEASAGAGANVLADLGDAARTGAKDLTIAARNKMQKTSPPHYAPPRPHVQVAPSPWSKGAGVLAKLAGSKLRMATQIAEEAPGRWAMSLGGRVIGRMSTSGNQIRGVRILDPKLQGLGLGRKFYGEVARRMPGQTLHSDMQVSDKATRLWDSLRAEHGWKPTIHPWTHREAEGGVVSTLTKQPWHEGHTPEIDALRAGSGFARPPAYSASLPAASKVACAFSQEKRATELPGVGDEGERPHVPGLKTPRLATPRLNPDQGKHIPVNPFRGNWRKLGGAETVAHEAGEAARNLVAAIPEDVKHGLLGAALVGAGALGLKATASQAINPRPEGVGLGAGARAGQKVLTLGLSRAGSGPVQY